MGEVLPVPVQCSTDERSRLPQRASATNQAVRGDERERRSSVTLKQREPLQLRNHAVQSELQVAPSESAKMAACTAVTLGPGLGPSAAGGRLLVAETRAGLRVGQRPLYHSAKILGQCFQVGFRRAGTVTGTVTSIVVQLEQSRLPRPGGLQSASGLFSLLETLYPTADSEVNTILVFLSCPSHTERWPQT
jgi:hypothetical protein